MTGTWKFFTETSGARLPMEQISFWFMFIIIAIGVFSSGTKYLLCGLFCLTDNYKLTKVLCNLFFFYLHPFPHHNIFKASVRLLPSYFIRMTESDFIVTFFLSTNYLAFFYSFDSTVFFCFCFLFFLQ